MKRALLPALVLLTAFMLNPILASAEESTCYILATMGDVYITVDEKKPGDTRDTLIWKGVVKNGQEQMVKSSSGKVSYHYKPADEDRTYGDNHASCQNGNVIRVP